LNEVLGGSQGRMLIPSALLVLLMGFWAAECRPPQPSQELDAVDLCIFNCDSCFKVRHHQTSHEFKYKLIYRC